MKRLKPPQPRSTSPGRTGRQRRTVLRFGFSAIIASFVVLSMLILGAMFQEEYEEGFVRIVSFAVRLATPEEVAEAEAQGPIPDPLPSIRPDTPIAVGSDPLIYSDEWPEAETVTPAPDVMIPLEGLVVETPEGLELLPLPDSPPEAETPDEQSAEAE